MLQISVLVVLFSIHQFHHDTSKHTHSGQISTSDGHGGNGKVLRSMMNLGFPLKGMMIMHGSAEETMINIPQFVSRKPQIVGVECHDVGWQC